MKTAIKIGSKISKNSAKNLGNLISTIFKVGKKTRMEQSTIQAAIHLAGLSLKVENTSVNGCSIIGDKTYE